MTIESAQKAFQAKIKEAAREFTDEVNEAVAAAPVQDLDVSVSVDFVSRRTDRIVDGLFLTGVNVKVTTTFV
jgi:hypothetical protein